MDEQQRLAVNQQFDQATINARQGAKQSLEDLHQEIQQFANVKQMLDDLNREARLIHKEALASAINSDDSYGGHRRANSELGHISVPLVKAIEDDKKSIFPTPKSAYQEAYSLDYLQRPDTLFMRQQSSNIHEQVIKEEEEDAHPV